MALSRSIARKAMDPPQQPGLDDAHPNGTVIARYGAGAPESRHYPNQAQIHTARRQFVMSKGIKESPESETFLSARYSDFMRPAAPNLLYYYTRPFDWYWMAQTLSGVVARFARPVPGSHNPDNPPRFGPLPRSIARRLGRTTVNEE